MSGPNFELLKDAYAIISGIPESQIDLGSITKNDCTEASCNTIACAAGYLAMHPQFNALGLSIGVHGGLAYQNQNYGDFTTPLSQVFNLTERQAMNLFSYVGGSGYDAEIGASSDKTRWQKRVEAFLNYYDQWRGLEEKSAK
ncbi:hypothetical protein RGU72_04740 [Undibacterium sp. 5I1]|uniref:hypothetical protein n=1 Tax=unclassified Undibacterium TaxID=2630295 RepID=UPI002AB5C7AD|nr:MULTISPECIES: hypothetical protein [unclassified Undibacterium]MDY7537559.1 hypothetical protein [Undibacterium sp. 5I1]MEB0231944.1 hypothetical protein [Undibacterium sp. 10I3]MEB0256295.1 hypothetical protein [Undibacterium sp. 5I1]